MHHRRAGESASFAGADYVALIDAAHRRLGGPIVVVWDNLGRHISARMRWHLRARDWLMVVCLPAYAPELGPGRGRLVGP